MLSPKEMARADQWTQVAQVLENVLEHADRMSNPKGMALRGEMGLPELLRAEMQAMIAPEEYNALYLGTFTADPRACCQRPAGVEVRAVDPRPLEALGILPQPI
jgi:hypothetical protein